MRRLTALMAVVVVLAGACGGGSGGGGSASGGQTRTVQVDWKHDAFSSALLKYYPSEVTVRPGDKVTFHQNWSGEPHSVTLGTFANDAVQLFPLVQRYDTPEDARKAGVPEDTIQRVVKGLGSVPPMVNGSEVYQPGAQPCYIDDPAAVPTFQDVTTNKIDPTASCPTAGRAQPRFTGKEGLYNSGFIPFQGAKGNTFSVPVASNAAPGTYRFYCNYHFIFMSGSIKIVPKTQPIPSQVDVDREAQKEVAKDTAPAVAAVRKADKGQFGEVKPPVAGLATGNDTDPVAIDQFFPSTVTARVGNPVTWTVAGIAHTISFNVPKYFPVFTVAKGGAVHQDPKSQRPVGFQVPDAPPVHGPGPTPPRQIDAGTWDGSGGFHSSGLLGPGDTFTVTFTKPGTYLYACVVHPPMVAKVVVKA
jgi:plastocyanin